MAIGVKSAFWANGAVAQITPDRTLGAESSVVTLMALTVRALMAV